MIKEFEVEKEIKPIRLDLYLKTKLLDYSRKKIAQLIKEGLVLVNNKKVKPKLILKGKEKITVFLKKEEKELIPLPLEKEPEILYEDENYLIINKPNGVSIHPNLKNLKEKTIASWLIYKYKNLINVGEDKLRPGIVHRLDKETSGILVICKNNQSFFHLKEQFQKRLVEKEYLALVKGVIKKDKGIIDFPLSISKKSPFKRKVVLKNIKNQKIKPALTYFEVLKRFKDYTLLRVIPKTGRTHQIRVHLSSLGFPIVGDTKYGFKKKNSLILKNRLFLHATKISFKTIDNKVLEIESPLDEELISILNSLPL